MIYVTPQSQLERTLQASSATHLVALLSPDASFTQPSAIGPGQCLHLSMHDIAAPRLDLSPPSAGQVEQLLAFARQWGGSAPMVVHCYAGISRSTAAAFIIAAALMPERDEMALAQELRARAPSATPNPLIIAHADRILGREGRMVRAIHAIGRGCDAFEGTPFHLPLL